MANELDLINYWGKLTIILFEIIIAAAHKGSTSILESLSKFTNYMQTATKKPEVSSSLALDNVGDQKWPAVVHNDRIVVDDL